MIVPIEEVMSMSDFYGQDEKTIQRKLNALELLIRKYTNNNFQNRNVRFAAESLKDRIFGTHPFIKEGDTIQISSSAVNNGLYTVVEVDDGFIRVNKQLYSLDFNLVTKVVYPEDIQDGVLNLLKYEIEMRDKAGIKSESLSRHSVTYVEMDAENQVMGYPVSLMGFLEPYKKARF
jgi:hypothetical protein